jgi:L-asparaginase II
VLVEVRRGDVVESRHRGHIVQVAADGAVQHGLGDPGVVVNLRSAVKPFTLPALIESGAADAFSLTPPELALMAGSHSGEDMHVRTLQSIFRRASLSQSLLRCGSEGMPLDELTAARLCRDGETPGPVRHMCSAFHLASILLSRHAGWPVEGYDSPKHPSQVAARDVVARVFGVAPKALVAAPDSCGLPTYAFPLRAIARAYAVLADPEGAAGTLSTDTTAALVRVRDAMLAAPEMVAGTRNRFDTAVMKARSALLVSKGGAEGLIGISLLTGAQRADSRPAGVAVKIEDGDSGGRAARAAGVEALAQLGVLDAAAVKRLAPFHRPPAANPRGERIGETVAGFALAPLGELT